MYADPKKQGQWQNEYRKRVRKKGGPVADKIRASCNKAERKRYWSDPEYRQKQIDAAAARVKAQREKAKEARKAFADAESYRRSRLMASIQRLLSQASAAVKGWEKTPYGYAGSLVAQS